MIAPYRKQYAYYKALGEKAMAQLSEEQLLWQPDNEANSIAIIVNHLSGNMLSRWTDFLISDGEKEWRQRDREFEAVLQTKDAIEQSWNKGWSTVLQALEQLSDDDLQKVIYIRNQGHTVEEALLRQMAHYAYHIGQIVYIGRMLQKDDWESLSIPKGASKAYNAERFAEEKGKRHFTDAYFDQLKDFKSK